MPRDGQQVRRRLQLAALDLYGEHGYDRTTAADIAAHAGVTERTFFRHFPDKREVLFEGEAAFVAALTSAISNAPSALGPWETLLRAFRAVEPLFIENRALSEPRRRIIAKSPALQERQSGKVKALVAALALALCERGVPAHQADLAAQMGMAALNHAFATWIDEGSGDLGDQILRAFREVHGLSSPLPE